ncbi:NAD-dependent protein deacylase SIR4 [Porphyridium purpureum]|uniref:NAD-dependent protein deacylase SIR4 n=1 Tax=Porphyridium purpureum TaxID=35688 RepID=A0A5J4Z2G9_PORPP|nr:NAD-dependent protein deacylase SIR4 [Porphyridium purpureum]|eukprot:POR9198..scf295_1
MRVVAAAAPCIPVGVRAECTVEEVERLAAFVRRHAGRLVVLSGAGISTEPPAGIPDYRSNAHARPVHKPITDSEFMKLPAKRQRYWARSCIGYERVRQARPNAAHFALTALHRGGWSGLHHVTQNVDGLMQQAHLPDAELLELHGSVHYAQCLHCGERVSRAVLQEHMMTANAQWLASVTAKYADHLARPDGDARLDEHDIVSFVVPRCGACGKGGTLKPGVVFFGGSVPAHVKERAAAQMRQASAVLVVGSTLTTYSAFGLVKSLLKEKPNAGVAILTSGPTRADSLSTLKIEALIGNTLARVLHAVSG